MMPLALLPKALALVMYSDLEMVALGRPKNSRIMSMGSATSPAPQNTMNNSQPVITPTQLVLKQEKPLKRWVQQVHVYI